MKTPEQKAADIYRSITLYSPRKELGGIEQEWIEAKIAEGLKEYTLQKASDNRESHHEFLVEIMNVDEAMYKLLLGNSLFQSIASSLQYGMDPYEALRKLIDIATEMQSTLTRVLAQWPGRNFPDLT